jgi:hypothetical protein
MSSVRMASLSRDASGGASLTTSRRRYWLTETCIIPVGQTSMDFDEFDHQTFELLVGMLLVRQSYKVTRTPARDVPFGPDFEAIGPDGTPTFVEVKHFRRSSRLPSSVVDQFLAEVGRIRAQHVNAQAMLVTSGQLSDAGRALAANGDIKVWDRQHVLALLASYPDVASSVEAVRTSRGQLRNMLEDLKNPATAATSRSERVAAELKAIPAGRSHWRDYEAVGTRIMADMFSPHLGAPDLQSRSEDGLDIMDAVFPVRGTMPPWATVRSEYRSRFAVAEFKNYVEPIGQRQVESIAQYLWHKAFRSFGLLVSRNGHDSSAKAARRRAWIEQDRLIVLLRDEDLVDMTQLWEEGQEPFQIIDAQLEEFFRRLSP